VPRMSIVVPAYNEGPRVYSSLVRLDTVLRAAEVDAEVLVVDDGSSDSTRIEAQRAARGMVSARVLGYSKNRGMGYAVKVGVESSRGEWIAIVSADQDEDPSCVLRFLERVGRHDADVVLGSKWHPDSEVEYPLHRRMLSYAYRSLVHVLLGVPFKDTQGPMLFEGELGRRLFSKVATENFAFSVEFLARAYREGARIVEVPIVVQHRKKKSRRVLRSMVTMLTGTVRAAHRLRSERRRAPESISPSRDSAARISGRR